MKSILLTFICLFMGINLYAQVITIKFDENHEQIVGNKLNQKVEIGTAATIVFEIANPSAIEYHILVNQEEVVLKDGKAIFVQQLEEAGNIGFDVKVSLPALDKAYSTSIIYHVQGELSSGSSLPEGEDYVLHKKVFELDENNMLQTADLSTIEGAVGDWLSITTYLEEEFEGQLEVRINDKVIKKDKNGNSTFLKQIKSKGKQSYRIHIHEYDKDKNMVGSYGSIVFFDAGK